MATTAVITNWIWNGKIQITEAWAGIGQSVLRLATGWMVRGSNSGGGEIFCTLPDWSSTIGTASFSGVKRPERGVNHPTHLTPRLKKVIYSPSGPSWLILGWPVPLPLLPSRSTEDCAQFNHGHYKKCALWYAVILITDLLTNKSEFLLYQV
jgi:hypothetical protein